MSSSIGLNKLRPSLIAAATHTIRNTQVSLYVHGAPGISKSAVARQVADSLGIAFIDVRLSQMAPEDVRGIPMLGERDGMTGVIWHPPLSFPRDLDYVKTEEVSGTQTIRFFNPLGDNRIRYCTFCDITAEPVAPGHTVTIVDRQLDRFTVSLTDMSGVPVTGMVQWRVTGRAEAILGLEEFNSAPPSVMAAAYQLILDRRLGDYLVPDGVTLLAMGNRDHDKGTTYKLPKPVANRFVHLEMKVDFEDWSEWAIRNTIHSDVVGYLTKWPSKLFDEEFAKHPEHPFATPRSWEFVSKIVSQPNVPKDALRALICGAIGDAQGNEFLLHRQFTHDMPDIRDIFSGNVKTFRAKNPQYTTQIAYSLCVQICYDLKVRFDTVHAAYRSPQERDKSTEQITLWTEADRALGYIIDNFAPEISFAMHHIALRTYKLRFNSTKMPRFLAFASQYRDLVMG